MFRIISLYWNANQNSTMVPIQTQDCGFKIKTESNKFWLEPGEIGTLCIAGENIK